MFGSDLGRVWGWVLFWYKIKCTDIWTKASLLLAPEEEGQTNQTYPHSPKLQEKVFETVTPGSPWTPRKCPIPKEYLCVCSSNTKWDSRWTWLRNLSWSAEPLPHLIWINNSLKDNQFGSHTCPVAELGSISARALPCPAPAADEGMNCHHPFPTRLVLIQNVSASDTRPASPSSKNIHPESWASPISGETLNSENNLDLRNQMIS